MAGHPVPFSDKILWIVRLPRGGQPLKITAHPVGRAAPVVTSVMSAGSSPGQIYPSDIVVPTPGCWQLTLAWHGHSDTVDLRYISHR
jgi:hypothetical protein